MVLTIHIQFNKIRKYLFIHNFHLDADASDSDQGIYLVLEPVVVLLGDLEGLGVLLHPGGLLGVALEDGEEHDQQGGVGGVQDLAPHAGAQNTQLLHQHLYESMLSEYSEEKTFQ